MQYYSREIIQKAPRGIIWEYLSHCKVNPNSDELRQLLSLAVAQRKRETDDPSTETSTDTVVTVGEFAAVSDRDLLHPTISSLEIGGVNTEDFAGTSNLLNTSKPKRFRTGVNITVNEKLARNDQTTRSEPDNLPVDSELIQHANCGDENGLLWNEVGVGQNDLTMKPPAFGVTHERVRDPAPGCGYVIVTRRSRIDDTVSVYDRRERLEMTSQEAIRRGLSDGQLEHSGSEFPAYFVLDTETGKRMNYAKAQSARLLHTKRPKQIRTRRKSFRSPFRHGDQIVIHQVTGLPNGESDQILVEAKQPWNTSVLM
ncbi:hypothetical protein FBUS_01834 [Fasciolopsis buskii]|uniref:Uncharacterized protein n=1 Tax=Fasciolopsis buskii TaxID=27845 RepID=A0A8E0VE17_9TREM|nr:hypothetical protein FBUS_01834 [Fasciolopsis buski]